MGKILVIAEKPSLGRSIAGAISWWKGEKFERQGKDRNTWLESDNYIVVSLVGHLYELIDFDAYFPGYDPAVKQPWDLKKLPFFPDDWKFKFEGKEKVQGLIKVANQQMNRKDVDAIYNAGDPDREGQRLVDEVLLYGLKAPKTIYRLWLPDTTNKTIKQAFETAKPNAGYVSLSSSAETRSEIDWLLGIELTRYVSIKAGGFTRIGRCVCPIVQHIIEREKAIKEFVPKPYSAVSSKEKTNGEEIELTSKRTFEEGQEAEAQALADAFNKASATVTDVKTERKTVNPGKLFSMSDLQSFACKADKTLSPADVLAATQALYEGGYAGVVTFNGVSVSTDGYDVSFSNSEAVLKTGDSEVKFTPSSYQADAIEFGDAGTSASGAAVTHGDYADANGTEAYLIESDDGNVMAFTNSSDMLTAVLGLQ